MILATVWMLVTFMNGDGNMQRIAEYRTRAACEAVMLEAATAGYPYRCLQTSQLLPKSYYEGLR